MPGFFKRVSHIPKFDRKVLRKNDISILILDERYNSLFENTEKTPLIIKAEDKLKELLKEQARLTAELKEILPVKKNHMDKIIKLTPKVFEENDENAKKEMQNSEKEIKRINERAAKIEEKLDEIPATIREANIILLKRLVKIVYFKIRNSKKREKELERLIEDAKDRLKAYIDEKEMLSKDGDEIYSYFHDLIGVEELEKLDKKFFSD